MADTYDDRMERLLSGDLSPADQRHLAQAALDDPDLFDRLTAAVAVERAVSADDQGAHDPAASSASYARRSSSPRRWVGLAIGGLAIAAALLALVYVRPPSTTDRPATPPTATTSPLPFPTLLATRLDAAAATSTFRTGDSQSRNPKSAGAVLSVDGREIEVDVGSLDGLQRGTSVHVTTADGASVRATIGTVFRERARGRTESEVRTLRVGDRVDVAAAAQVNAWLERASARQAAGDLSGAETFAREAASHASTADVTPDVRRRALEQFGVLARNRNGLEEAERSLSAAVGEFDAAPAASPSERAEALNELGFVLIMTHDYDRAERTLRAADAVATGATKVHVTNNLAAVAALRGDRASAESLYREAHSLAAASPALASERAAIEANLDALVPRRPVPQ